MKLLGTFLLYLGGISAGWAIIMCLFSTEKSKYDKIANKLYRWMLILGICVAVIGGLLLKFI